jgi:hypothetical protein
MTLAMIIPASYASRWLAIPWLAHTVGSLPFLIQLPLAIVVADLSQYATHRAFHRIPFLWRFHAIHHSIETMDWVAGSRSHYIDILLTRGLILIPMTLFGFSQADDLAGAVLRDRALSPLASRCASGGGGCQLRHPPPIHRSLVRHPLSAERRLASALRPGRRIGAARLLQATAGAVQAGRSVALI